MEVGGSECLSLLHRVLLGWSNQGGWDRRVGKTEGKRQLRRPRCRRKNKIRIYLREM